MADAWHDLVNAALLGVERRPFAPPALPGLLDARLKAGPEEGGAALLAALGALDLYRRAGQAPLALPEPEGAPALARDLPPCSAAAGQQLALMLTGQFAEALPEWLGRAARAGQRVPAEHLPALLDLARARDGLRAHAAPVLGRRGEWLAAQNPDWETLALGAAEQLDEAALTAAWETAPRDARLNLLRQMRRQPALRPQALALLAGTWKQESAEDRAAFTAALAEGLSLDDEAFLEAALDDRAKNVRRAAAELLACLPESQLAQRMAERLRALVVFERGWFKARRFGLEPPVQCDAAMQRDGIEPKPRGSRGERAAWLLQIVAAAPLGFWTETLDAPPAECVRLAATTEWRDVLIEGWSEAVTRQASTGAPDAAEWAEALLRAVLEEPAAVLLGVLLLPLAPERREEIILGYLRADTGFDDERPATRLLAESWEPWSAGFSGAVLDALCRHIARDNSYHPGPLLGLFRQMAFCADPAVSLGFAAQLRAAAQDSAGPVGRHWPEAVERYLAVAEFRHAMHQELPL
jgi:hypothetical protein